MMSLLSDVKDLCLHNQKGFCKFGARCHQKHENEICQNRSECTSNNCRKRHPRLCRYYCQFGHCKFGQGCAYSHKMERKCLKLEELEKEVKNDKEKLEKLEKEVKELKEDKDRMKRELTLKFEKEMNGSKDALNSMKLAMEKQVGELKDEMNEMKQMFGKLYKLFQSREAKRTENKTEKEKENEEASEKDEGKSCKEAKERFKCDMCEYETNKKVTLKKHMNTKHGTD